MAVAAMADQTLESRIARLESDVAHIRSDIGDIKIDIRWIRAELSGTRDEVHKLDTSLGAEISKLDHKLTRGLMSNRIWMLLQGGDPRSDGAGIQVAVAHHHTISRMAGEMRPR